MTDDRWLEIEYTAKSFDPDDPHPDMGEMCEEFIRLARTLDRQVNQMRRALESCYHALNDVRTGPRRYIANHDAYACTVPAEMVDDAVAQARAALNDTEEER